VAGDASLCLSVHPLVQGQHTLVPSVSGMCSEKKSAVASASSKPTRRTPSARAFSSEAYGSCAITVMPSPFARRATSLPTCARAGVEWDA
jgi:hypothetical protein